MPPFDTNNRFADEDCERGDVGTRRNSAGPCKRPLSPPPEADEGAVKIAQTSRRQVQFDQDVKVSRIPHYSEYGSDGVALLWNTASDYARFRQDVADTLYLIAHVPNAVDGIRYTARGIEGRTRGVSKHRHRIKAEAWSAVFDEQTYQKAIEEPDADWIAAVYQRATVECVQEALELAQLDVIDVSKYQQQIPFDLFDDSWISSVASQEEEPVNRKASEQVSSCLSTEEDSASTEAGDSQPIDCSGFDDSWITDVARSNS